MDHLALDFSSASISYQSEWRLMHWIDALTIKSNDDTWITATELREKAKCDDYPMSDEEMRVYFDLETVRTDGQERWVDIVEVAPGEHEQVYKPTTLHKLENPLRFKWCYA